MASTEDAPERGQNEVSNDQKETSNVSEPGSADAVGGGESETANADADSPEQADGDGRQPVDDSAEEDDDGESTKALAAENDGESSDSNVAEASQSEAIGEAEPGSKPGLVVKPAPEPGQDEVSNDQDETSNANQSAPADAVGGGESETENAAAHSTKQADGDDRQPVDNSAQEDGDGESTEAVAAENDGVSPDSNVGEASQAETNGEAEPGSKPGPGSKSVDGLRKSENKSREAAQSAINEVLSEFLKTVAQNAWFAGGMKNLVHVFDCLQNNSEKAQKDWPKELSVKIEGRQKGLRLTGKILKRCADKTASIEKAVDLGVLKISLPEMTQKSWKALQNEPDGEKLNYEIVQRLLEQDRDEVLAEIRRAVDKTRSRFLNLVEKSVLPILDGLDDGEHNTKELVEELAGEFPDQEATLREWFQTYGDMREKLLGLLADVSVITMVVKLWTPVDYERHEPFDTEAHEGLPNETVLTVSRNGYEFMGAGSGEPVVLRAAQVIVVKN